MKALRHAPSTKLRHKLRNSLFALSAVCAISGVGLFFVEPAPQPSQPLAGTDSVLSDHEALSQDATTAAAEADATEQVDEAPAGHQPSRKSRRSRHSASMPFFSFSARS